MTTPRAPAESALHAAKSNAVVCVLLLVIGLTPTALGALLFSAWTLL